MRDFVGSLVGHSAHKGILITTAQFTAEAKRYAERVPQKVILIDGFKLAELMIDFNIGVTVQETYAHKKINEGGLFQRRISPYGNKNRIHAILE